MHLCGASRDARNYRFGARSGSKKRLGPHWTSGHRSCRLVERCPSTRPSRAVPGRYRRRPRRLRLRRRRRRPPGRSSLRSRHDRGALPVGRCGPPIAFGPTPWSPWSSWPSASSCRRLLAPTTRVPGFPSSPRPSRSRPRPLVRRAPLPRRLPRLTRPRRLGRHLRSRRRRPRRSSPPLPRPRRPRPSRPHRHRRSPPRRPRLRRRQFRRRRRRRLQRQRRRRPRRLHQRQPRRPERVRRICPRRCPHLASRVALTYRMPVS